MEPLINFEEHYKTVTDTELLRIVQNPGAYQPVAVKAAQAELNSRQLNEEELATASDILLAEKEQATKKQAQVKELEKKVRRNAKTILQTLDPQRASDTSPEKLIRLIVILLGILWLWYAVTAVPYLISGLGYPSPALRAANMRNLILLGLLPPIALFFFWLKTKPGWMLLASLLVHQVAGSLATLPYVLESMNYSNHREKRFMPDFTLEVAMTIFWIGVLVTICRPGIRTLTGVTKTMMLVTLVAAAAIIGWLLL